MAFPLSFFFYVDISLFYPYTDGNLNFVLIVYALVLWSSGSLKLPLQEDK